MKEKSHVEDIDRSIYDFRDEEKDAYRINAGLTPEIVEKLSKEKHDPAWMELFRLQSLQIYNQMPVPDWGPSIEGLNMDQIVTYVRPNTKMQAKWSDVPEDIKNTFERLGIPEAERKSLAGVGAQYDSELVYHNVREEVAAQGVVYTDMESALNGEYADMVRKHFMKLAVQMLGLHIFFPRQHLIRIATNSINFTIMDNKSIWMRSFPAWIGIGRKTGMYDCNCRVVFRTLQILKEGTQLSYQKHSFIYNRPTG